MTGDKTLLLVGTYCGLNKGDRLMQQVMIEGVLQRIPNCHVTLASPFNEIDRDFYPKASVVRASRRNLPLALSKCLLMLLPFRLRCWIARRDRELSEYMNADLVVDLSGDMLTEDYGLPVAISHAIPLCFARLLKRKYMVIAQSIGPFRLTRPIYRWLLQGSSVVTARDPISHRNLLSEMQLNNLQETSDLGFLLRPSESPYASPLSDSSQFQIGIAPSGLLMQKFGTGRGAAQQSLAAMADMLNRLAERFNARLVLIPHVQSPRGAIDDVQVCNELRQFLDGPVEQLDSDLTPAEVKSQVGHLDMLIAYRMHAALAGLDSAVPTIGISYSHKTDGLFERLGLENWVVKNDESLIASLEKKVADLFEQRDKVRSRLQRILPEIRDDAKSNLELVAKELSRGK
jgi:colanic acid/amylovoran biosynthesis protein